MKRLVTVQDISCVGKCSLTVALPVISAMGVETCILPTAVLSAHTLFPHPVITDLTGQILPTIAHWKEQGITFDAIYTGYLADSRQIDLVIRLIREFGAPGVPVIVDPAMADNGTLYAGFSDEFPMEMLHLCRHADIILPNITEAALMTGIEYRKDGGEAYLKELLLALSDRLGVQNFLPDPHRRFPDPRSDRDPGTGAAKRTHLSGTAAQNFHCFPRHRGSVRQHIYRRPDARPVRRARTFAGLQFHRTRHRSDCERPARPDLRRQFRGSTALAYRTAVKATSSEMFFQERLVLYRLCAIIRRELRIPSRIRHTKRIICKIGFHASSVWRMGSCR